MFSILEMIKKHLQFKGVDFLQLIINKINGYIVESNGDRYLMLFPTDESIETLKSMKNYELKSKI